MPGTGILPHPWLCRPMLALLAAIFVLSACPEALLGEDTPVYGVRELSLTTDTSYANPYLDVSVVATFRGPTTSIRIEGFWDGGNIWKVRMSPTEVGTWTLVDVVSNDSHLNRQLEGYTFIARNATPDEIASNAVLEHGFITVNPLYPHTFMHSDGTPFFFMGDTHWGGTSFLGDLFRTSAFQKMVDTRAAQGFTVFTATHLALQSPMGNEGGAPFSGPHPSNELNPEFFRWVDRRIDYMTRKGIRPMILIGAPDADLTSNPDWLNRIQRYIIARWAAYDIIWFGVKEYQEWGVDSTASARALGTTIERYDPYRHPVSFHPGGGQSSHEFGSDPWLDFISLQRGGGANGAPAQAGVVLIASDYAEFSKPVVQTEAFYEEPGECRGPNHFSDPEILLEGLWAVQLHGGWNAGYRLVAACTRDIDAYLGKMSGATASYHTRLRGFFEKRTAYWKLKPANGLVKLGTAWAAANAGNEYVLYLKKGGDVALDLGSADGIFNVDWYDPRSGEARPAGSTTGGATRWFHAPTGTDWVLHIYDRTMGRSLEGS